MARRRSIWRALVARAKRLFWLQLPRSSGKRSRALFAEPLEDRRVLDAQFLGDFRGRFHFDGDSLGVILDSYQMEFRRPNVVVDAQLIVNDGIKDRASFSISGVLVGETAPSSTLALKVPIPPEEPASAQVFLPSFSGGYTIALAADDAPGNTFSNSTDIRGDQGRDLGTLSIVHDVTRTDFIGYLWTNAHAARDLVDTYFFNLPQSGTVSANLRGLEADASGGAVAASIRIFSDFDQDGRLEASEALASGTGQVGTDVSLAPTLNAGRHAIVVSRPSTGSNLGGSDYRLDVAYSVSDVPGETLATARDIGPLGNNGQTLSDYLNDHEHESEGTGDTTDIYRFATSGDGPFTFSARLTDHPPTANFNIHLIRDANGNGQIDTGDVLASTSSTAFDELTFDLPAPGTYYVRVRGVNGEGPYTMSLSSRNQDLGGSTLATAFPLKSGLAGFEGLQQVSDRLSATDTADIFRFVTTNAGTIQASMTTGSNADLQLVRDLDNDQVIDASEVLALSANPSNQSESLSRFSEPGTYYLHVYRIAGSPSYSLTLNLDTAGSTLSSARTLVLNGGIADNASEFVGPGDATDTFAFTINQPRRVTLGLTFLTEPVNVVVGRDTNSNGVLDGAEESLKFTTTSYTVLQAVNLTTSGTYFVKVVPVSASARYVIQLASAAIDNAGNTLGEARDLGPLAAATQSFGDSLGDGTRNFADDHDDYYRFTLPDGGPYIVPAVTSGVTGAVGLQLIRDDNLNGQIDEGEVLDTRQGVHNPPSAPVPPAPIIANLVVPGTYYLRVFRLDGNASYTLSLSAISQDTAGNTLAAARDLGALSTTLTAGGFVGRIDTSDVYRFSVGSRSELAANLSGAVQPVAIEVIRDADNDLAIDPGETLVSTENFAIDSLNGLLLPAAGDNYFVRVLSTAGNSSYSLDLEFSSQTPFHAAPFAITNSAAVTIEAEEFDRGGDGIATKDSTEGNSGNDVRFRSAEKISADVSFTADLGGGRRIVNTAAGEYLEYTLQVAADGLYAFEFRVAAGATGASFHAEIDGVAVTQQILIPSTGGDDNFITLGVTNIPLTAGPHILRLAMDTADASGSAGSYNFITIRPAAQATGTFALTPQTTKVVAGQRTPLSLAWTVPAGGWRVLKDVDVRLKDNRGTAVRIRFDEATNTLRLFNPRSRKFGPAKTLGSSGVLSNGEVTVDLRTSSIQAEGPTAPTVVLTLDLSLSKSLRGRRFGVEVAARDDLGHVQPFELAGFVEVARGKPKRR